MRILVISQYFYPETFRINDIVKELVSRGHVVTVLTGLPNYPEGKIYEGYKDSYRKAKDYCGALVYRCKLKPRKKGSINLLFNYISFVRQAKKTLKHIKPVFDIVYFYEPSPITSGIPAIWYGKKHKIKTVIYNMDIWPDSIRDYGRGKVMSKLNPLYLAARFFSKRIYTRFDFIINKCDDFATYLNTLFGISFKKMTTIYEHAEETYLRVNIRPIDNGVVDFVFLGNLGKTQNCESIIKAFASIDTTNSALHFVGGGSSLEGLKKLTQELCTENKVFFYGQKSIEETIPYYNLADVCLMTLSNKTMSGKTPPGKFYSYLAAARPIIAAIDGSSRTIISLNKCGYVCDPDNPSQLANIFESIIKDPSLLNGLGENGRRFFLNNLTLEKHVDCLEQIFAEVINNA